MQWDATEYYAKHDFVFKYGESLLSLMPAAPGKVLDIGCGTGELSQELAEAGFDVVGVDQSEAMLEKAIAHFPAVEFELGDILNYAGKPAQYDALFSNACFHWIRAQDRLANVMHRLLKPNGILVAEFGGVGNIQTIADGFKTELAKFGIDYQSPFYFPSVSEYRDLLTRHGFQQVDLEAYDRPTPLKDGRAGLRNWVAQFFASDLEQLSPDQQNDLFDHLDEALEEKLWHGDHWEADYRRLRVRAQA